MTRHSLHIGINHYEDSDNGVDGVPVSTLKRAIGDAGCDCAFFIDACPAEGMGTRNISVQKSFRELDIRNLSIAMAEGFQGPSFAIMSPETSIEATVLAPGDVFLFFY